MVLAVNVGDPAEKIREYFEKEKFGFRPLLQQSDEVSRVYKVSAYPTNYLIGADGKIAYRAVGFQEAALRAALEKAAPKK